MIQKEKPDGCVCVMPIPLIVPLAKELMEMGMPVTVEKPPGASIAEAQDLLTVSEQTATPHMVSVNRRFQPLICEGRNWALSQGPIRFVRASMLRHNRREDVFVSGTGIHSIDALRFLAGDVLSYESAAQRNGALWHHFVFQFASGAMGSFDVLPTCGCLEERYEIYGENYRVDMAVESSPEPRLRCWKDNKLVVDKCPPDGQPHFIRVGPYAETHEFVTALLEKRAMWPTMADVFPSLKLAYQLDPSQAV
jgi:predicted dehydrogenase